MAAELPGTEDESSARAIVQEAVAALSGARDDIPAGFVTQLFGHAVPEDLVRFGAVDVATLAERTWDFLAERQPGAPKIRCETVALTESGPLTSISVIEIVNDDMPFLFDSVMGELAVRRLPVRLVAHPVFGVRRDGGRLVALGARDMADSVPESVIHIHLDAIDETAARAILVAALDGVLTQVRLAVTDWQPMLRRLSSVVSELKNNPPPLPVGEIAEAIQFLQWLQADNFTFLGMRDYRFDGQQLVPDFDSGLGIMR